MSGHFHFHVAFPQHFQMREKTANHGSSPKQMETITEQMKIVCYTMVQ